MLDEGIISKAEKDRYSVVKTIDREQHRVIVIPKTVFKNGDLEDLDDSTFEE